MDEMLLAGLRFKGRHGVTPEEKVYPQEFEVDLVLHLDLKPAGETDLLEKTVDYARVYQEIKFIVEQESFNLIERLAERIAEQVLNYHRVERVEVTVKKIRPPLEGDYSFFSVRLVRQRQTNRAFIGLGTNLGNREENLAAARQRLARLPASSLVRFSSVYPTSPWGKVDQPPFLNQVASVDTRLTPRELLQEMLAIENDLGRQRQERWGPRVIDLDLLLYGHQVIREDDLTVPHPHLTRRAFVLAPLMEIAPDLKLPDGTYIREILANLSPAD